MTSAPPTNIPVAIPATGRRPGAPLGAPTPQPATIRGQGQTLQSLIGRFFTGTPGRMRLLAILGVVACLALGATSVNALITSREAAQRAAVNTEQVVRAQTMQVDLLRADALATNAFLQAGLESAAARTKYDEAIARVATALAKAASSQPSDQKALGVLATKVQTYVGLVETARADNRLGKPLGAQYLAEASAGLRSDAIPVLKEVVKANEARATQEFGRADASVQLFGGVASIIALVLIAVWLARRTHRYVNPSLAGAVVLLIAVLVLAATSIGSISRTTSAVSAGEYAQAVQLADIHTSANDARSNESLTLVRRGSGGPYETAWKANDAAIRTSLAKLAAATNQSSTYAGLSRQWSAYSDLHVQIRAADNAGDWNKAVEMATAAQPTAPAKATATTAFDAFEQSITAERDRTSNQAIERLKGLGGSVLALAIALSLAALVAAWLVVRGIGKRIEEYR